MALAITLKWGCREYSVTTLSEDDTVLDLKQFLKTLTGVLPERQKLLGLKVKGKPAENDVKLGTVVHAFNPSIWEAEAGRSPGQPGLHREILS